jgi:hypothetical protein
MSLETSLDFVAACHGICMPSIIWGPIFGGSVRRGFCIIPTLTVHLRILTRSNRHDSDWPSDESKRSFETVRSF